MAQRTIAPQFRVSEIIRLKKLLDEACCKLNGCGVLKECSHALRDWWGKRRSEQVRKADLPMEKWKE